MPERPLTGVLRRLFPSWARRYGADRQGNIAIMAAIFIPVIVLALGGALDYISAARREDTLNGIADAAALATTTPAMMQESCYPNSTAPSNAAQCTVAVNAALNAFNAQSGSVQGVGSVTPTVYIVDTATPVSRTTTVSYTGTSTNAFAGVLHINTFALKGHAMAQNSASPVTTFYMLIDESPSMYFPATSAGVTTMVGATPANFGHPASSGGASGGCALGCHDAAPGAAEFDNLYNPADVTCSTGANALSGGVFTDGSNYFGCVTSPTTKDTSGSTAPTVLPTGKASISTTSPTSTTTCTTINGTDMSTKDTATQTLGGATSCLKNGAVATCPSGTPSSFKGSHYFGAEDNFALSRCLAVTLRIDLVNEAVTALMTTAPTIATQNKTTYAVDLYTIDLGDNGPANTYSLASTATTAGTVTASSAPFAGVGLQDIYNWGASRGAAAGSAPGATNTYPGISTASIEAQTTAQMNTYFTAAQTAAAAVYPLETWGNGQLTKGGAGDGDSDIDKAGMEALYATMPTPGKGTSLPNDTPEEVLFIVSDGLNDVNTATANTTYPSTYVCGTVKQATDDSHGNYAYYNDYGRPLFCPGQLTTGGVNICTAFKNKNIRIAFLYLAYEPLDPDPDYIANVEPWQFVGDNEGGTDEVEQGAIACASPGLEFTVTTDADITSAMQSLFQKAIQTAYLSA